MNKSVFIFLAEGFEEVEAVTPIDVLRRAELDVKVVSTTNSIEVKGAHDITIKADGLFNDYDFEDADMLLLPGGLPGTTNLLKHKELLKTIKTHHDKGKWLAAICAAPSIFGHLGLLKNKTATCYPGFENKLTNATVTANSVEVSENIITGRGVGVAINFALEVALQLSTKETAKQLAHQMVVNS